MKYKPSLLMILTAALTVGCGKGRFEGTTQGAPPPEYANENLWVENALDVDPLQLEPSPDEDTMFKTQTFQPTAVGNEATWRRNYSNWVNACGSAPRDYRTFRMNRADQPQFQKLPILYVVNGSCNWYDSGARYSTLGTLYQEYQGVSVYVDGPDLDGSLSLGIMWDLRNVMINNCRIYNMCQANLAGYSRGAYIVITAFHMANNWLRSSGSNKRLVAHNTVMLDPVNTFIYGFSKDAPGVVIHLKKTKRFDWGIFANGPIYGRVGANYTEDVNHPSYGHFQRSYVNIRTYINSQYTYRRQPPVFK